MLKDYFIKQSIKEVEIEEFIRKYYPLGDYSKTELQRTPLGIKIVIYTNKPGRIIGRGGKTINEMTDALRNRFNLENPQIDVKTIANPNLDAKIVAKQIASALEKGYNYKKIGNLTVKRVMGSGAIGVQIVIAGKLTGGKGLTAKFTEGYIKYAGYPAEKLVDAGFEEAQTQPGKIGIKVRILKEFMDITGEIRDYVHKKAVTAPEEKAEEPAEEAAEEKAKAEKKPKARKKKTDVEKPKKDARLIKDAQVEKPKEDARPGQPKQAEKPPKKKAPAKKQEKKEEAKKDQETGEKEQK